MNRFWARATSTAATALLAGLIIPACAHNDGSIFIRHVMAPPGGCVYQADPSQVAITEGLVDASLTGAYTPWVLIGNQLTARASVEDSRVESARVVIQGALVKVVDPADGSVQMDNTVLTSGTVDPGTGTNPSWGVASVTMMNQAALAHFDPGAVGQPSRLGVAYVKVFGETLGGQSVESNEFQFPINVCHGCLVFFPPGSGTNNYCAAGTVGGSSATNVPTACVPGQDEPIDCSLCYPIAACDPARR
jgi:hypothetical protein